VSLYNALRTIELVHIRIDMVPRSCLGRLRSDSKTHCHVTTPRTPPVKVVVLHWTSLFTDESRYTKDSMFAGAVDIPTVDEQFTRSTRVADSLFVVCLLLVLLVCFSLLPAHWACAYIKSREGLIEGLTSGKSPNPIWPNLPKFSIGNVLFLFQNTKSLCSIMPSASIML